LSLCGGKPQGAGIGAAAFSMKSTCTVSLTLTGLELIETD
jgi:hypothetical protein